MASALLAQLEVVGRLLVALEGTELARVGLQQSQAFCANLARVRVLSAAEKSALVAAIEVLRLPEAEKARLLTLVHGKNSGETRKRPLQDYVAWPSFCTPRVWQSVADYPSLAVEILCQQMSSLGLINASKDTQKSIAAHAVMAEFAKSPFPVSEKDANRVFKAVGKRLKQLCKAEPMEYIVKLPSTPAEFLRLHPLMAKAVFSRANLPCVCPLNAARVSDAAAKIHCRGGADTAPSSGGQPSDIQQMMMFMMNAVSSMVSNSQQGMVSNSQQGMVMNSQQGCRLTLLPPGTKGPQASQAVQKFLQLADRAVPAQQADVGSSIFEAAAAADDGEADLGPPSLQPLSHVDRKADAEEEEPVAAKTPSKAGAMRGSIMAGRAGLADDRAAAGALAKTAGTPAKAQKKKKTKQTKKTGTPKKAMNRVVNKSKSWLKARPNGCGKCRYVPGCTKSCYLARGQAVPK